MPRDASLTPRPTLRVKVDQHKPVKLAADIRARIDRALQRELSGEPRAYNNLRAAVRMAVQVMQSEGLDEASVVSGIAALVAEAGSHYAPHDRSIVTGRLRWEDLRDRCERLTRTALRTQPK